MLNIGLAKSEIEFRFKKLMSFAATIAPITRNELGGSGHKLHQASRLGAAFGAWVKA